MGSTPGRDRNRGVRKRPENSKVSDPTALRSSKRRKVEGKATSGFAHHSIADEVFSLGGDEEDVSLLEAVATLSEDEMLGATAAPIDQLLRRQIAALSEEIGLPRQGSSDATFTETIAARDASGKTVQKDKTILAPRPDWLASMPESSPTSGPLVLADPSPLVERLKRRAMAELQAEGERFKSSASASTSHKFLSTIMASGTLSDKVSALTLAVQESPVHNVQALEALLNLASKRNRSQAQGALDAIVDLLARGSLLPSDRRLRYFRAHPPLTEALARLPREGEGELPIGITRAHLVGWAYEDWLKETFFKVVQILEQWSSDELEYCRARSVDLIYSLLKEKPEQESNLLRLLVNKLGDKARKISSRSSYLLLQVQNLHPGMKAVVVNTIKTEFLLRPGQSLRALYNAVNTLNQTILSSKEPTIAESLLDMYFMLFLDLLKAGVIGSGASPSTELKPSASKGRVAEPSGESDKLVSALLTGVNRTVPFITIQDSRLRAHLDTLFRISHSPNFNTSVQALVLIKQLYGSDQAAADRFYRTLYESLLDHRLASTSKPAIYLNLLLRSLKDDVDIKRVKAFVKRILQVAGLHQPSLICGLLYIVAELRSIFPDIKTLVEEPEDSAGPTSNNGNGPEGSQAAADPVNRYHGRKRDPCHSNAQKSCLWEISPIASHFHPSVAACATSVYSSEKYFPKPELESHTLIRFLDKFAFRPPKTSQQVRGSSIMQPTRAKETVSGLASLARLSSRANASSFWNQAPGEVSAEDKFFHQYFAQIPKRLATRGATKDSGDQAHDEDEVLRALASTEQGGSNSSSMSDDESLGFSVASDEEVELPDFDDLSSVSGSIEAADHSESESTSGAEVPSKRATELRSSQQSSECRRQRKAWRNLPTFAPAEGYANLIWETDDLETSL